MDIEKLFSQLLQKLTAELECANRDIQVLIFKNKETGEIEINLYKQMVFVKKLDISSDILGLKLDFMNKGYAAKLFLGIILGAFANELACEETQVSVQMVAVSNEESNVCMALQKDMEFVRWISFDELKM